ncbi:MAG: hypothetical protein JWO00_124 [Candidatus Parcubacteria bacterium]|nr:hypothetical protein [Candidatus Parcubacteria bacterium]
MPDDTIREIAFSEYPITLRNIPHPPRKLFIRGRLPEDASITSADMAGTAAADVAAGTERKYLCIVGSRKWTTYGRDAVNKIVKGLKGYPITIVSGLAIGIDSIAHMAALEAGLHCIAFPGSSLGWDELYPREHAHLGRKIVESGGALISQWQSGYQMGKWAFPARNVLMAGISHATLIVEAGPRSGSLMTARHAEEFDRDIFAVPGPITASLSYGPHMLIRNGAALVSSSEDVLEALGFDVVRASAEVAAKLERDRLDALDSLSTGILGIISREDTSVEVLAEKLQTPSDELMKKLSVMELEGYLKMSEGKVRKMQ